MNKDLNSLRKYVKNVEPETFKALVICAKKFLVTIATDCYYEDDCICFTHMNIFVKIKQSDCIIITL